MPSSLRWALVYFVMAGISYVVPGGRVMVIPFVFMLVLALLFRSAQKAAERQDAEES